MSECERQCPCPCGLLKGEVGLHLNTYKTLHRRCFPSYLILSVSNCFISVRLSASFSLPQGLTDGIGIKKRNRNLMVLFLIRCWIQLKNNVLYGLEIKTTIKKYVLMLSSGILVYWDILSRDNSHKNERSVVLRTIIGEYKNYIFWENLFKKLEHFLQ